MASSSRSGEQTDPCTLLLAAGPGDTAQRHGACLVVIRGERLGARLDLATLPAVIGRGVECRFPHSLAQRYRGHIVGCSRVTVNPGSKICARPIRPWSTASQSNEFRLTDGDQIRIGDSVLKFFSVPGNLEAGYLAEMREHAVRDELTGL